MNKLRAVLLLMLVLALVAGIPLSYTAVPAGIDVADFGFFAWFGFVSCFALIIVALLFGVVLKRKEKYYDD